MHRHEVLFFSHVDSPSYRYPLSQASLSPEANTIARAAADASLVERLEVCLVYGNQTVSSVVEEDFFVMSGFRSMAYICQYFSNYFR